MTRYLCITRVFPLDGGKLNNVLADICILNEKEAPYQGFSLIDKTQDTGEPALKKKTISVKMVPRSSAQDAVCDVIILSKNKRAPAGYTLIGGDINGLTFCYKLGTVPPESRRIDTHLVQQSAAPPLSNSRSFDATGSINLPNSYTSNHHAATPNRSSVSATDQRLVTQQDTIKGNAIHDVPFQLHSRYQDPSTLTQFNIPSNIQIKTRSDLDNEFTYPFVIERSAIPGS